MLGNKPPYTTMQQLNLDWILSKLKTLLRLVPDDGAVGQILRRTRDGAVWSDEQGGGGGGAVESVNGQTGAVVLDAADVGALPDDYTPPVTSVNGQTGAVVLDAADVGALPDDYTPPVTSVNGQTGAVVIPTGGAVDSVNGQTGTVVLDAADVGALPDDYTPPVTSVNGQTGDVVINIPPVPVDYIIEQGVSGSWSYRKWNSGKMEAWYVDAILFPAPQQGPYNGFYRHVKTISIISGFSSILMTLAQGQNSCMFIVQGISTISDTTLYLLHSVSNTANITVADASIYIVGTWN